MYTPNLFQETDPEVILEFLQQNTFVTVVSISDGSPIASHIPISVKQEADNLVLYGHVAKANSIWKTIENSETLIIFQGPHAYVSPIHYDKVESVPTWNYRAAHVYGQVKLLRERQEVEVGLSDLISQYEATYQKQWDSLSEKYKEGMLAGIIAFKMSVTRIEAAAKLSQNKTIDEQSRIADALSKHPATEAKGVGAAMHRNIANKESS